MIRRTVTRLALLPVLFLSLAPAASFANIITYDFTVNGGSSGPLAGVVSTGYFSYDNSIQTPFNHVAGSNVFTDFAFTWNGVSYDENTLASESLGFTWDASLTSWVFGTKCQAPGVCGVGPKTFDWAIGGNGLSGWISYGVGGNGPKDGAVTLSLRQALAASVPEPAMLPLMMAGFASLAVFVRRRQRAAL